MCPRFACAIHCHQTPSPTEINKNKRTATVTVSTGTEERGLGMMTNRPLRWVINLVFYLFMFDPL